MIQKRIHIFIVGRVQGKIRNGKFEGYWIIHRRTGELWGRLNYKNGKYEGFDGHDSGCWKQNQRHGY